MLQQLRKCKTLKELYEVIGTERLANGGAWILYAWCFLPLIQLFYDLYYYFFPSGWQLDVFYFYQDNVLRLGCISVAYCVFYLIGKVLLHDFHPLRYLKKAPWHFMLLLMLFWSVLSTMQSVNVQLSLFGSTLLKEGLITYFFYAAIYILAFLITDEQKRLNIFRFFCPVAALNAIIIILQVNQVPYSNDIFFIEASGVLFHFNHAGYYLCMAITASMGLYLYEQKKSLRVFYLICFSVSVCGLITNSCFGSFLGAFGGMTMLTVFCMFRKDLKKCRLLLPIGILIFFVFASYMEWYPSHLGETMRDNFRQVSEDSQNLAKGGEDAVEVGHRRVVYWLEAFDMIKKRPVFGYGPNNLDWENMVYLVYVCPDNEFIQHALFLGIPAAILYFLAVFCLCLTRLLGSKKLFPAILIAFCTLLTYLGSSLFGLTTFYTTPYLYLFFGLTANLLPIKETQDQK